MGYTLVCMRKLNLVLRLRSLFVGYMSLHSYYKHYVHEGLVVHKGIDVEA
jgi:hypothetical protein